MGASDRPTPGHHQRAGVAEAADAGEVTGETGEREAVRETARDCSQISRRLYPMPTQPTHALWQAAHPRLLPFHNYFSSSIITYSSSMVTSLLRYFAAWLGVES